MRTSLPPNLVRSNLGQLASRIESLALYANEVSSLIAGQDNEPAENLENVINLLEQAHGEALEVLQNAKRTLSMPPPPILALPTQAQPAD